MPPIRVLVVDDSVVVRRLVHDVLAADPDIEVVGTAANGQLALTKIELTSPDVVTMDIEMPVMNGIEAVRAIRAKGLRLPIVMFSTLTERGAAATLDALSAGASDYVTKPANVGSVTESMDQVRQQLIPKVKGLVQRAGGRSFGAASRAAAGSAPDRVASRPIGVPPTPRTGGAGPGAPVVAALREPARRTQPYRVLAIGCSTGGPEALPQVLAGLPADLPVPVLVVQHMPPVFTAHFAARLDARLPLTVVEAVDGTVLRPGHVYIAPGDYHLEATGTATEVRTRVSQGPPENFCRPAVDVLFRSVVRMFAGDVLAAVLTGMGSDGRRGAEEIVAAGGSVLVQDEPTSVVWGMPGAVATAGLAEAVVALPAIGSTLAQRLQRRSVTQG